MSNLKARLVKPTGLEFYDMGIVLNERKTQIISMRRFTFLKVRYCLTGSGRVVMKPCRASFSRMRRKLRSFRRLWLAGRMTMEQIRAAYTSWRGYQGHMDAHRALRTADRFFDKLFEGSGKNVGVYG